MKRSLLLVLLSLCLVLTSALFVGSLSTASADVTPETVEAYLEDGAGLRLTDEIASTGIRFTFTMDANDYEALHNKYENDIWFGVAVAPKASITRFGRLNKVNLFGNKAKYCEDSSKSNYVMLFENNRLFSFIATDGNASFRASVINFTDGLGGINVNATSRQLVAVAYIKWIDQGVTNYRVFNLVESEKKNVKSLAEVLQTALVEITEKAGEDTESIWYAQKEFIEETFVKPVESAEIPTTYTVSSFYKLPNGTYTEKISEPINAIAGETISATPVDTNVYEFDSENKNNVLEETAKPNDASNLKVYYKVKTTEVCQWTEIAKPDNFANCYVVDSSFKNADIEETATTFSFNEAGIYYVYFGDVLEGAYNVKEFDLSQLQFSGPGSITYGSFDPDGDGVFEEMYKISSAAYQPVFKLSASSGKALNKYAKLMEFNTISVKTYAIQADNGFEVNGVWTGLNSWVNPINVLAGSFPEAEVTFWSQSQGITENYVKFEVKDTKISFPGTTFGTYTVDEVTDDFYRFNITAYQPHVYLNGAFLKTYAEKYGYNELYIKGHTNQANNGFVVNGDWKAPNGWFEMTIAINSMPDSIDFWSQSETTTDNYIHLELRNNAQLSDPTYLATTSFSCGTGESGPISTTYSETTVGDKTANMRSVSIAKYQPTLSISNVSAIKEFGLENGYNAIALNYYTSGTSGAPVIKCNVGDKWADDKTWNTYIVTLDNLTSLGIWHTTDGSATYYFYIEYLSNVVSAPSGWSIKNEGNGVTSHYWSSNGYQPGTTYDLTNVKAYANANGYQTVTVDFYGSIALDNGCCAVLNGGSEVWKNWEWGTLGTIAVADLNSLTYKSWNSAGESTCRFKFTFSDQVEPEPPKEKAYIVKDGASDYAIVIPENASDREIIASQELQFFFEDITGITLTILKDSEVPAFITDGKYISLGQTRLFKNSANSVAGLIEDAYIIAKGGDIVYVCGGSETGTVFGVYGLLNQLFELEIFTANCWTSNFSGDISIDDVTAKNVTPSIATRTIYRAETAFTTNQTDYLRLKLENVGERSHYLGHSFYQWMPVYKYFADHNDWYVGYEGSPSGEAGWQLAVDNAEMRAEFVSNVEAYIRNNPDAKYIAIGANDGYNNGNGYTIDHYVAFYNYVTENVRAWIADEYGEDSDQYKNIRFYFLAYCITASLPANTSLASHLDVMVAPVGMTVSYPINDTTHQVNFTARDWNNIVTALSNKTNCPDSKIMLWHYATHYADHMAPLSVFNTLDDNIVEFANRGASYVFIESELGTKVPMFSALRSYLESSLMFDSSLNQSTLTAKFFNAYYGKGSAKMIEYYNSYTAKLIELDGGGSGDYTKSDAEGGYTSWSFVAGQYATTLSTANFPLLTLQGWLNTIKAAEDLEDDAIIKNRIQFEKLNVMYIILSLYGKYYNDEGLIAEYAKMCADFKTIASNNGFTYVSAEYIDSLLGDAAISVTTYEAISISDIGGDASVLAYGAEGCYEVDTEKGIFWFTEPNAYIINEEYLFSVSDFNIYLTDFTTISPADMSSKYNGMSYSEDTFYDGTRKLMFKFSGDVYQPCFYIPATRLDALVRYCGAQGFNSLAIYGTATQGNNGTVMWQSDAPSFGVDWTNAYGLSSSWIKIILPISEIDTTKGLNIWCQDETGTYNVKLLFSFTNEPIGFLGKTFAYTDVNGENKWTQEWGSVDYQPLLTIDSANIETIKAFATANGYKGIKLMVYTGQFDNACLPNIDGAGLYWGANCWNTVYLKVEDLTSLEFKSQSEGYTNYIFYFELLEDDSLCINKWALEGDEAITGELKLLDIDKNGSLDWTYSINNSAVDGYNFSFDLTKVKEKALQKGMNTVEFGLYSATNDQLGLMINGGWNPQNNLIRYSVIDIENASFTLMSQSYNAATLYITVLGYSFNPIIDGLSYVGGYQGKSGVYSTTDGKLISETTSAQIADLANGAGYVNLYLWNTDANSTNVYFVPNPNGFIDWLPAGSWKAYTMLVSDFNGMVITANRPATTYIAWEFVDAVAHTEYGFTGYVGDYQGKSGVYSTTSGTLISATASAKIASLANGAECVNLYLWNTDANSTNVYFNPNPNSFTDWLPEGSWKAYTILVSDFNGMVITANRPATTYIAWDFGPMSATQKYIVSADFNITPEFLSQRTEGGVTEAMWYWPAKSDYQPTVTFDTTNFKSAIASESCSSVTFYVIAEGTSDFTVNGTTLSDSVWTPFNYAVAEIPDSIVCSTSAGGWVLVYLYVTIA